MAGPATQAAANVQAMQETLRGAAGGPDVSSPNISEVAAAAAITADDWSLSEGYNDIVFDSGDPTWDATTLNDDAYDRNTVFYNRSGPMSAPYGGGNAGDQFS